MTRIILHVLSAEKYFEGVISILKREIKDRNIIYVTTNKPLSFLINSFKDEKIDINKIFFIDCISKHIREKMEKEPTNCLFLESPQSLTAMSIAINESVKNIKGLKMLFFDSLSVLLIYNDANTIGKFSNFLLNKMRTADVDTIMLTLESDVNKDVIKQIESFVDEVTK